MCFAQGHHFAPHSPNLSHFAPLAKILKETLMSYTYMQYTVQLNLKLTTHA